MSSSAGNLKRKQDTGNEFSVAFRLSAGTTDTSNVTLINQKKHVFFGNNQLNQSGAKEAQPIISWHLTYVFLCLVPVTGFPALGLVCFLALCIGGSIAFPRLAPFHFSRPKGSTASSSNWNIALFSFLANFQVSLPSLVYPSLNTSQF